MTKKVPSIEDLKLIPTSNIPPQTRKGIETDWLELFKSIPKGRALVITRDEGLSPFSAMENLYRYQRKKLLPPDYRAFPHTVDGKLVVYVVHGEVET